MLPIVEVDLQPPSHPFSKGSIYVKVPQITLFVPPQGIEPRCYSTTPNVLSNRRRGYRREMILLALLTSRKSNSCTQPTRRFSSPTSSNSDNPASCFKSSQSTSLVQPSHNKREPCPPLEYFLSPS